MSSVRWHTFSSSFTVVSLVVCRWVCKRKGATFVKIFHASLFPSPRTLKSMLSVGPLGTLSVMPSGGISPDEAGAWWDAGWDVCVECVRERKQGVKVGLTRATSSFSLQVRLGSAWDQTWLAVESCTRVTLRNIAMRRCHGSAVDVPLPLFCMRRSRVDGLGCEENK